MALEVFPICNSQHFDLPFWDLELGVAGHCRTDEELRLLASTFIEASYGTKSAAGGSKLGASGFWGGAVV